MREREREREREMVVRHKGNDIEINFKPPPQLVSIHWKLSIKYDLCLGIWLDLGIWVRFGFDSSIWVRKLEFVLYEFFFFFFFWILRIEFALGMFCNLVYNLHSEGTKEFKVWPMLPIISSLLNIASLPTTICH